MYGNGPGVPQAYVQAHMWFNLAAAQGYEGAAKNRDPAASKMTPCPDRRGAATRQGMAGEAPAMTRRRDRFGYRA